MRAPSDGERPPSPDDGLGELRERLLGVEERASVKSWFPRLRETVARLAESEARLRKLNEELEDEVEARTEELRSANAELERKNDSLERAFEDLRSSREALLRSERLAASAALAGSIAHELNSPLGALISSTSMLDELARAGVERLVHELPRFDREEGEAFRSLVAAGAARVLEPPERRAGSGDRLRLEDELGRRGLPRDTRLADALLELGVGPDSPLLETALAYPRAADGAMLLAEILSSAAVARRAGEKAAEAVRRLQESVGQ